MNENPITVVTLPDSVCYPPSVQGLLNLIAEYATVEISGNLAEYAISASALPATSQNQLWFQTSSPIGQSYGAPRVARLYVNGQWLEFAQLTQGDRILVADNSPIVAPWGENPYTYSWTDTGITSYTPTAAPTPPVNFKYKTYVGYWDTKS